MNAAEAERERERERERKRKREKEERRERRLTWLTPFSFAHTFCRSMHLS